MTDSDFNSAWHHLSGIHYSMLAAYPDAVLNFVEKDAEHWPSWYLDVISRVYALTRGEEIVYLSSSITSEPAAAGEVVAFTRSLVAHVGAVEGSTPDAPTVVASAWRRSDLTQVSLVDLDPFYARQTHYTRPWPTRARIELRYTNGRMLTLPLIDEPPKEVAQAAADAYEQFIEDLARSS